jgi:hypothetical protein
MTFEQKVRAMSAKEIIMAMVNGLKKEHVKVTMSIWGEYENGRCYGCAATNTICEISGIKFKGSEIDNSRSRAKHIKTNPTFLEHFEAAINELREGCISGYNYYAKNIGIAKINGTDVDLPRLETSDYLENLHYYERLAELQQ